MKTFICSDWHLGEDRFKIIGRPFRTQQEMIDTLVENHNSVVGADDEVIFVGDVCYNKAPEFLDQVGRFHGKKILYRGNHDRIFTDSDLAPYFERIIPEGVGDYELFGGVMCYITHYPSKGKPNAFNLVGHIHSAWKYQLNSFNIGVDCNHFYPHNAEEAIPAAFNAIASFYGEVPLP